MISYKYIASIVVKKMLTFEDSPFALETCAIPDPYLALRSLMNPSERHAFGLLLLVSLLNNVSVKFTLSKHNLPFVSV